MMASDSLIAKKEKIQRQIETLERRLGPQDCIQVSSGSDLSEDDGSEDSDMQPAGMVQEDLEAERERIQREIEDLERTLGPDVSCLEIQDEEDGDTTDSNEEDGSEDLDLPQNAETCLQMNLVYQQVLEEKMADLERLLHENREQQREVVAQMSSSGAPQPTSSSAVPLKLFLGNFMKPYFKDKVTGLGPPANSETRDKKNKGMRICDEMKTRRWEGWQKTLLLKSVVNDTMKRLLQPKLSKLEYLTTKKSKASDMEKQILEKQISEIEREIADISAMKEDQLVGNRHDDHDWEKISNIDFEGTRSADDMRRFWENYLHPSVNKSCWKEDEIEKLKAIVKKHNCSHWDRIAEELGTNRTAFMCLQTHQNYISKELKKKTWTRQEDNLLRELVEKMRIGNFIPYTQISYFMEGREAGQLIYRWTQVLNPSLKKGHWTKEEDEMLLKAVKKYGERDWWKIRQEVPGRSDGQCRDRYLDCLKTDVKKGPWNQEEEALLIRMVEKYGAGRWAKIASEIPNRTDCQCLQKWRALTGYKSKIKKKYRICNYRGKPKRGRPPGKRVEELEDSTEDEDEEQVVFMDTDDEKPSESQSDQETEVREKYIPTKIEEWVPKQTLWLPRINLDALRTAQSCPSVEGKAGTLSKLGRIRSENSLIVEQDAKEVLNTVLDRKGSPLEVIIGRQPPPELQQKNDKDENEMVRISANEARNLLRWKSVTITHNRLAPGKVNQAVPKRRGSTINNQLMQAVLPWMGNLLIPLRSRPKKRREADVVRQKGESIGLSSTPVFKLFLSVLNIDAEGCKKVIENRKKVHERSVQGVEPMKGLPPFKPLKGPFGKGSVAQLLYEKRREEYEKQAMGLEKSQGPIPQFKIPKQVAITQPLLQIVPIGNTEAKTEEAPVPGKRVRKPTGKALALEEEKASAKRKRTCEQEVSPRRKPQTPSVSKPITWIMTVNGLVPVGGLEFPVVPPNQAGGANRAAVVGPAALALNQPVSSGCVVSTKGPELPLPVANVSITPVLSILPRATLALPVSAGPSTTSSMGSGAVVARPVCSASSVAVEMHIPAQRGAVEGPHANIVLPPQPSLPTPTATQAIVTSPPCAPLNAIPASAVQLASVAKETAMVHPQGLPVLKVIHPQAPAMSSDSSPAVPWLHQGPIRLVPPNASPLNLSLKPAPQQGLRPAPLSFDPNLMFLEEESQVREWIKGTNGVTFPQLDVSLPYLPPFVGNLKTLLGLLQHKKALEMKAFQMVPSTGEEGNKEARLDTVRKLVAEKLSENPAYLLLKARFLSCFTLPAFLATVHPGRRPKSPLLLSAESSDGEESAPPEKLADNEVEFQLAQGAPVSSGDEKGTAAATTTQSPRMSTRRRSRLLAKSSERMRAGDV